MFNPNTPELINLFIRAIVLVTAMPIHECAHGWVANKLGDPTARNLGRLTLNPLVHLDPAGSLLILLAGVGWARPVPVNTRYFKNIKRDMALVAVAGPLSNILLALLMLTGLKLYILATGGMAALVSALMMNDKTVEFIFMILSTMISVNIGLAVFNLLPIPPLDGSRLFTALLPARLYYGIMRYERVFMGVLMALLLFGVINIPMGWAQDGILTGLDWMTGFLGRLYG